MSFDREYEILEEELEEGSLTNAEFNRAVRELRAEQRDHAYECANNTYNDVMRG